MSEKKREILYSPGFGAGWTTWNDGEHHEFLATYQPIIDYVKGGGGFPYDGGLYEMRTPIDEPLAVREDAHPLLKQLLVDAEAKFGEGTYLCTLGARGLKVATVAGRYRIDEHDGNESIVEESEEEWR